MQTASSDVGEEQPAVTPMKSSPPGGPEEPGKLMIGETGLKLNIKQWHSVAIWKWVANDVRCGICRMAFEACCSKCHMPGDDCPLVWGSCPHCFHMHCVIEWLAQCDRDSQPHTCPMCRLQWEFKGSST